MKIVAVVSAKGGVGKTTLAANLASVLAYGGKRVLAVDLDPQNALRLHFGMKPEIIDGTARATLKEEDWHGVIYKGTGDVSVLPYGGLNESDRESLERQLDAEPNWLRCNLDKLGLGEDDIVVVDTPPGPSVYLKQALSTAQFALAVVLADAASYATIPMMENLLGAYCANRMDFVGVAYVINQVDQSRLLGRDVVKVLRATLEDRLFPGVVHLDQAVSEALAYDTTTLHYDALSQATQDFKSCAEWVRTALDKGKR